MSVNINDIELGAQIELYDKAWYKSHEWRRDLGVPSGWGQKKEKAEVLYGTIQTVKEITNIYGTLMVIMVDSDINVKGHQIKSIVPKSQAHSMLDKKKKSDISTMQMKLNLHLLEKNKQ